MDPRVVGARTRQDRTATTAARSGPLRQAMKQLWPRRDLGAGRPLPVRRRGVTRSESDARPAHTHTACVASVARSRRHTKVPAFKATANRLPPSALLLYLSARPARLPSSPPPMPCPALASGELASSFGWWMHGERLANDPVFRVPSSSLYSDLGLMTCLMECPAHENFAKC